MFNIKNILILISMVCFACGCATTRHTIKATQNTELVETEGIAPIINNNLQSAKETALKEALKNSLGLVVGVYLSQESLVEKSILIEDNISSQTEGYIEKYEILNEVYDDKFYKTKIKALVRKEDLLAKMKSLELNTDTTFKPIISIDIKETIDNKKSNNKYGETELKKILTNKGYKIHLKQYCDILITGMVETNYDTSFNNIKSYQAICNLKVANLYGQEISNKQMSVGGAGITKETASKTSCQNAINKVADKIILDIDNYTKEKSIVLLYVSNVKNINQLNGLIKTLRTTIEIKDCIVRKYDDNGSLIELYLKYPNIEKLIVRLKNIKELNINKYNLQNIVADYVE